MLFNRTHMRNMVAISPMDTGAFCHSAAKPAKPTSPDCAAWDRSMGTLILTLPLGLKTLTPNLDLKPDLDPNPNACLNPNSNPNPNPPAPQVHSTTSTTSSFTNICSAGAIQRTTIQPKDQVTCSQPSYADVDAVPLVINTTRHKPGFMGGRSCIHIWRQISWPIRFTHTACRQ